jgi:ATP-dependent helicase/DNAse subunit B
MRGLKLYTGPFKNSFFFEDKIFQKYPDFSDEYIYFLPANRAVRNFKRRLISHVENAGFIQPFIFTFDEFLTKIYRIMPNAKQMIKDDSLIVFLLAILEENKHLLKTVSPSSKPNATILKRLNLSLKELRRFGYSSQNLGAVQFKTEGNVLGQNFFTEVLSKLEEKLADKMIDESFARFMAESELTEDVFRKLFPNVNTIFMSGYGLFSPTLLNFIQKAAAYCHVEIKVDYIAENQALFQHTKIAYEKICEFGAKEVKSESSNSFGVSLFNRENTEKRIPNEKYQIVSAKDATAEVEFIAAKIKEFHLSHQIPLNKFAITFPHLEKYASLLSKKLNEYGIPFNISTGNLLSASNLIKTLMKPLQLKLAGFPIKQTLNYFNNRYLNQSENSGNAGFLIMASQLRLSHLHNRWYEKLQTHTENKKMLQFAQHLKKELLNFDLLPPKASILQWRERYLSFLEKSGLLNWYENVTDTISLRFIELEYRAYNAFMKVFEHFIWTTYNIYRHKELSVKQFYDLLSASISGSLYSIAELPEYGVQIVPRLEILFQDFEVLFVGGLVDGVFPRSNSADAFFNDEHRKKMGLFAKEEILDQDRFIFYQLLALPSQKTILSHPSFEGESALTPSVFLDDLRDVCSDTPDIEYSAPLLHKSHYQYWKQLGKKVGKLSLDELHTETATLNAVSEKNDDKINELFRKSKLTLNRHYGMEFGEYEGLLSADPAVSSQLKKHYQNYIWSAARLEKYVFCPIHFLFHYIFQLKNIEDNGDQMTALEKGNLIHLILYRYYSKLKALNETHEPTKHFSLLKKIALEAFSKMDIPPFFLNYEMKQLLGNHEEDGLLYAFARYDESEIAASGFKPGFFELSFGQKELHTDSTDVADAVLLKTDKGSLRLKGSIDRIDVRGNEAIILDYKTGSVIKAIKDVVNGLSLQLPIYLLASQKIFPETQFIYGGHFQINSLKKMERIPLIADKERWLSTSRKHAFLPNNNILKNDGTPFTLDELLALTLEHSIERVHQLQNGVFRHTTHPENHICTQLCEYKKICRKNTAKIKRIETIKSTQK